MQLLTNLCLLSYQLILTSGLRVIDNGLGEAVYYEENIFDDALLAADTEAALPSQVSFVTFAVLPAFQFTICSSATSDALLTVVHFFQLLRQSGDPWITLIMQPLQPGDEENMFYLAVREGVPVHIFPKSRHFFIIYCIGVLAKQGQHNRFSCSTSIPALKKADWLNVLQLKE